jgi:serine/threonine-protein kinase
VTEAAPIAAESVLAGRYRLVRPVAGGGRAQAWEAHDEVLGRPVAIKVLHLQVGEDGAFLEPFRREAVAAARLSHPHVVAVFDTGVDAGVAFIVTELVRGETLREVLAAQGALRPPRAAQIAIQVADALASAHGQGLVHRDIKPANILITDDGRVKVADFGMAQAGEGSAAYLAPEQVDGGPQDPRTDVYSLGVVLYEMLCGRAPFTGDGDAALAMQHLRVPPVAPRQVRAGIPRSLEAVVLTALAKAPGDRYESAADMRAALAAIDLRDDDAVVMATRDPTPPDGVAPSFAQTERSWLIPVVVILLVALALGTVGVLFARSQEVRDFLDPSREPSPPPQTVEAEPVRAAAFDPLGDRTEHDAEAGNVIDGDPATSWRTETYANRRLGNRKPGVGMVVELDAAHELARLEIASETRGYAVEIFVAEAPRPTLEGWGAAVDRRENIEGDATFDLEGRRGRAVLVWITDLGTANSTRIDEVRVVT